VVGLEPDIALDQRLALDEARVNLVRQDPRGFLTLAADTLSLDEDVRPINVRRLLSLLRRLATRAGARYVFEPNGDAFRRLVQRRLDAVLRALFERGAFAGSTAATSFQVVADPSVNPPDGIERGRLVVELRVAPSLSAKFIAVRLVQSGDRLAVEES
jgi:phage tail sheath protein FI